MSTPAPERLGEYSLCRLVIFRRADGQELARQGKKRVPHDHPRGMGAW